MKYGDLVKEARLAAGMTQAELGEAIQLDRSVIGRIEGNKVAIEPDVFRRLTTALRTLSPFDLVNALGYTVTAPGETRLPPALVRDLLTLPPEDLATVVHLVQRIATAVRPQARRVQ